MEKASKKQLLILASLIFGMFFGAGNLIFPAHLGQLAGENWLFATVGFLLSAALLPLGALIALSRTQSSGIYDFAKPVAHWYGLLFLILTHMALGPMFATPRTAALGYQFSLALLVPEKYDRLGLLIFSAIFYLLVYIFSNRENNLLKIIGKWLNPLFLVMIAVLFLVACIAPFGSLNHEAVDIYRSTSAASSNGFLEGYNTMDALAALAFGITIVRTLRSIGIKEELEIANSTMKSGALAMLLTSLIYMGIIALGAMSISKFPLSENGGIALTQIIQVYFGPVGMLFMSILTLLAVFTSAMGLIASFAQDFSTVFPKLDYAGWLKVTTILSFITANFGLNTIIAWTMPFLMILYPLAMALIIPGLFAPSFNNDPFVYRMTTGFVALPALLDGLGALPVKSQLIHQLEGMYTRIIPFASQGLGWVCPTIIALVAALLLRNKNEGS